MNSQKNNMGKEEIIKIIEIIDKLADRIIFLEKNQAKILELIKYQNKLNSPKA